MSYPCVLYLTSFCHSLEGTLFFHRFYNCSVIETPRIYSRYFRLCQVALDTKLYTGQSSFRSLSDQSIRSVRINWHVISIKTAIHLPKCSAYKSALRWNLCQCEQHWIHWLDIPWLRWKLGSQWRHRWGECWHEDPDCWSLYLDWFPLSNLFLFIFSVCFIKTYIVCCNQWNLMLFPLAFWTQKLLVFSSCF